jgi:subtilisin family serine protease
MFCTWRKIYATTPNDFKYLQGTSMAPNVAGVAAIIRSYYPKLTASQVKHILMDSGVAITEKNGRKPDSRSYYFVQKMHTTPC